MDIQLRHAAAVTAADDPLLRIGERGGWYREHRILGRDADGNEDAAAAQTLEPGRQGPGIACAFDHRIGPAPAGNLANGLNHVGLGRIEEMGCAEFSRHIFLLRIDIDGNNRMRARNRRRMDRVDADTAHADDGDAVTGHDPGIVGDRAETGGDSTSDQGRDRERYAVVDLDAARLRHDGEFRKARYAGIMMDRLATIAKAARPVTETAGVSGSAIGIAHDRQRLLAIEAMAAIRRPGQDDVIAHRNPIDRRPDLFDDPGGFMSEDQRQDGAGKPPRRRQVAMANAAGDDTDENFTLFRHLHVDVLDDERRIVFVKYGGSHRSPDRKAQFGRAGVAPTLPKYVETKDWSLGCPLRASFSASRPHRAKPMATRWLRFP